jgi:hypothetical protein
VAKIPEVSGCSRVFKRTYVLAFTELALMRTQRLAPGVRDIARDAANDEVQPVVEALNAGVIIGAKHK